MKKRFIAALAASMLTLTALSGCTGGAETAADSDYEYIKNNGKMVIGITEYQPMNYYDENGNLTGFDTEFAQAVCEKLGIQAEFQIIDWDTKEIFIGMIAVILLLAFPLAFFYSREYGDVTLKSRVIGMFIISVPFFIIGEASRPIIKKKFGEDFRAIELGDTYLMFAAGAFLGTRAVIASTFVGIITAAFGGLLVKAVTKDSKFAFGPFLAIGIAVGSLWGNQIAQWYLNLLATE